MEIRVAEDTLPCTKTAPHPAAFLSEVVQYWTAIYPELTHHQKAQSTLKPILPQERNRLKETIMSDKDKGKSKGELMNIVLGGIGAVLGGELINKFGIAGAAWLNMWSVLVSVSGAALFLVVYHALQGAPSRPIN
jgi:uncharacterized membrane protein YeaQ/YmgE (transglycosylase-associated protein family)